MSHTKKLWNYSYKEHPGAKIPYFDPLKNLEAKKQKDEKKELKRGTKHLGSYENVEHLLPPRNKSWKEVVANVKNLKETKIVYVTRHGNSDHNNKSREYGKPLYYQFYAKDPQDIDPKLSDNGIEQAKEVGGMIKYMARNHGLPLPMSFYSSPLRRCVQTAIYATKGMFGPTWNDAIHVRDGLREWIGWDHHHSSDKTSRKSEIVKFARDIGGTVEHDRKSEDDPLVQDNEFIKKEAYADVRRRIEETLNEIYDNDDAKTIHLFLHNRCFRSFLRVIGHAEEEEFDMENCATVVFLVTREMEPNKEKKKRQFEDERGEEEPRILAEKDKLANDARAHLTGPTVRKETAQEWYSRLWFEEDKKLFKKWRTDLNYRELDKNEAYKRLLM
jgi:broad specificity phosphatase PhoE